MRSFEVFTANVIAKYNGPRRTLADIVLPDAMVSDVYFIPETQLPKWRYLKGAKNEPRKHRASGGRYFYTEGALPFPDPLNRPGRTILTGEGGGSPSRFKHVVQAQNGRYRRLVPIELERLNGFDDGWTDTGMTDTQRAFCMGNALVVGLVERVGTLLAEYAHATGNTRRGAKAAALEAKVDVA
jgi:DNA (cytosine-5)-methyltransferase 1